MINHNRMNHFRPQTPTRGSRFVRFGVLSSRLMSFLILALLAILYVAQATKAGTKRVEVQQWRDKVETLEQDKSALELEAKRAKALWQTNDATANLQLEPAQSMEFLSSPNHSASPTPAANP